MLGRAVPLFVCSNQRPRLGWRCCSINQTAPVNLLSSGPVMPCGATVRVGSLSTIIEGAAKAGGALWPVAFDPFDIIGFSISLHAEPKFQVEKASAASSKLRSASRQRVKFAMSESEPSGRLTRYMPGHFGSGTMCGSSLRGLRLSVTLCGFCPSDISMGAVTLRTAPGATLGRVAALVRGVPRSRLRFAATRHRGPQKRAVERWGLNCEPQAGQVAPLPAGIIRPP
jgi:hypothetical protein